MVNDNGVNYNLSCDISMLLYYFVNLKRSIRFTAFRLGKCSDVSETLLSANA
jgi:hypothetical protein